MKIKRAEILNHKLRLKYKVDSYNELSNRAVWYICQNCGLEIYWSENVEDKKNPWKFLDNKLKYINLYMTCEEYCIKILLE